MSRPDLESLVPKPGHGQVFLGLGDEAQLDQSRSQLEHVYRLADPALSELGLESLLNELLTRARDILDVDTVAILLLDEDGKELVARAAKGLEEEVERGVRIPVGGGFAGRIAAGRTPIYIADVDHAEILNPILRTKGIRSLLGVPMLVEGGVVGVLHVGTITPRVFTNQDAALLQLAAARAAPAIERARLFEALDREHRGAVALQRSLLPDRLPDLVGIETAARYLPARDEVGGDWYDVVDLPGGSVGLAIGDVAGHGLRAAALMGQLRTGLRAYALEGRAPGETLKLLDRLLQTLSGHGMATAGYAIVDPATGALRYASAGHPPPVVVRQGERASLMAAGTAPPLGTLPFAVYHEVEATLEPGDTILLYTDGLVERRREPLTKGLERLRELAAVTASAEGLCQRVTDHLVPPTGGDDDIAVVALRLTPVEEAMRVRFAADPRVLSQMRRTVGRWLQAHGAQPSEIAAITLACGEACANAIEHAYAPGVAYFELEAEHDNGVVTLTVRDTGEWRAARGTNRGRGLKMMAAAVDVLDVRTTGAGTEVVMRHTLGTR
jgi:anti-sigma regulatory factor (Ser/Thr protein kinase)/putative methionine-R-sulfoxide reductase with GAF domain